MKKSMLSKILFVLPFLAALFLYQNCSNTKFSASKPVDNSTVLTTCQFNGQDYRVGESVTAYLQSSVSNVALCQSEQRVCQQNGAFTGSYSFSSCGTGPAACLFNGAQVAHGASITSYLASTVAFGQSCQPQTRTCNNGVLSGSYTFASCSVGGPASCTFNGTQVAHGAMVTAFSTSTVAYGQTCQSQGRVCNNGVLSGSYTFSSCSVGGPASCTFNGVQIANGASVTAYANSVVGYGQSCLAQLRTCSNGVLSGSYAFPSCNPGAPASCSFNGVAIPSGASVTAFLATSVPYGQSCQSQTRVCSNGSLSGSYAYNYCNVDPQPFYRWESCMDQFSPAPPRPTESCSSANNNQVIRGYRCKLSSAPYVDCSSGI